MAALTPQSRPPFDIAIVGLGITGVHHLTNEAEAVLRRSNEVFMVDSSTGVDRYVGSFCDNVTDLLPLYEDAEDRLTTYRKMAAATVTAALENPPVSFATYGHPWAFCFPTTLILRAARLFDLRVEVIAGISSLDTLMVDLGYDFSTDGLQMYDATDLLLRRRPLQDDVACVIWQATSIGDPTYQAGSRSADHFIALQAYLLEFYPPEQPVFSVFSRTHPALQSIVRRYQLEALADGLAADPQSGTLFIPPVRRRPIVDEDMLQRILPAYQASQPVEGAEAAPQ